MSGTDSQVRTVLVFARDRGGRLLPGTTVGFLVNGVPAGEVPNSEGRGSIELSNRHDVVIVSATYGGQTQTRQLAQNQDDWTFQFDVDVGPGFMGKHVPLVAGLGLLTVALVLGFVFGNPNTLQIRLILAVASLGGGLIATEIPGMLKVDVTLWNKVVIGATGALAVFVILYLIVPGT